MSGGGDERNLHNRNHNFGAANFSGHYFLALGGEEMVKLLVTFCLIDGHDPFICGVNGKCTIDNLVDIERDFLECYEDCKSDGEYTFSCDWFSGQYGEYGQCELAPGWEMTLDKFTPPEVKNG